MHLDPKHHQIQLSKALNPHSENESSRSSTTLDARDWERRDPNETAWALFVISSIAPEHVVKPDKFDSQLGYRPIGIH
jgi:hypothetical protein